MFDSIACTLFFMFLPFALIAGWIVARTIEGTFQAKAEERKARAFFAANRANDEKLVSATRWF